MSLKFIDLKQIMQMPVAHYWIQENLLYLRDRQRELKRRRVSSKELVGQIYGPRLLQRVCYSGKM